MSNLHAQLSFTDRTDLLEKQDFYSGVAIGIADMNGDGLDDIVRLNQGIFLQIEYQTEDCNRFVQSKEKYRVLQNPAWNIAIADINNDGWNDIMAGGAFESIKLLISIPNNPEFVEHFIPDSDFFAQGANFIDIDEDGFLDAFVCDDNAESKIFMNNQDGTFGFQEMIDFNTVPASDNSGNYGSIWTDFDSDGDMDLYIAKCRQGVDDPTDPRRVNALYVNDGTNHFTELAAKYGLDDGGQSWTADFGDLDLDGDFDCLITNHDRPSVVLENQGDTLFVDITDSTGINPSGTILQGVMQDLDNDGFLDIIISGTKHDIFINNGNFTFSRIEGLFDGNQIESFSIGDLNGDGSLDLYAGYAIAFNQPSNKEDKIWMNDGNQNHFIRVALKGDSSNANGIGARIEIFGDWGVQTREVRAGESYGISLSHVAHFGIGSSTEVDSLIINWPSGIKDVIYKPGADLLHVIHEGHCDYNPLSLENQCRLICEGEFTRIIAPHGYSNYIWSNGEQGDTLFVSQPGLYYVQMVTENGCQVQTRSVTIDIPYLPNNLELNVTGSIKLCAGEMLELTAPEVNAYAWNTGDTSRTIVVTENGTYFVDVSTACESVRSDSVIVTFIDTKIPITENDTILGAGAGILISDDPITNWYLNADDSLPILQSDTFYTPTISQSTSFFASIINTIESELIGVGQKEHTGFSFYNGNIFNGGQIFDVLQPMVLDSVTVFTEFPGKRIIEIKNEASEVVFVSDTMNIQEFKTVLYLGALLNPGEEYVISTNEALNNEVFGINSPRLYRSDRDTDYPYQIDDLISIHNSVYGEDYFYYFYDWKVKEPNKECESERVEVFVIVEEQVSTQPVKTEFPGKVFPVPADQKLGIHFPSAEVTGGSFQLITHSGQIVASGNDVKLDEQKAFTVDVSELDSGLYVLLLSVDGAIYSKKVIVHHTSY